MGDAAVRCVGDVERAEWVRPGDTVDFALVGAGVRGGEAKCAKSASLLLIASGAGGCVKRREIAEASTGSDGRPLAAGKAVLPIAGEYVADACRLALAIGDTGETDSGEEGDRLVASGTVMSVY